MARYKQPEDVDLLISLIETDELETAGVALRMLLLSFREEGAKYADKLLGNWPDLEQGILREALNSNISYGRNIQLVF